MRARPVIDEKKKKETSECLVKIPWCHRRKMKAGILDCQTNQNFPLEMILRGLEIYPNLTRIVNSILQRTALTKTFILRAQKLSG